MPIGSFNTLVDELSRMKTKISDTSDLAWVTFVTDHKKHIITNSVIVPLDNASKDRYKLKLEHFLRDNSGNISAYWICRMINDLNEYDEFTLRDFIYIPNMGYITNLYRSYRTSINH